LRGPYVDAVFDAASGLRHPSFALACGEIEAIVPPLLDSLAGESRLSAESLRGHAGVVAWDAAERAWDGACELVFVQDMDALPDATIDHIPKRWREGAAGWVELSRGCKLRCSFCFACGYRNARMRRFSAERVRRGVRLAAEKGTKVLGLYTASVSMDIDLVAVVVDAVRDLGLGLKVVGAVGPVDRGFLQGERLDRLSKLDWSVMTIGLQTVTPEAIRLARRADDPETFARVAQTISGFTTPEVELILGLPGDSPQGFRTTIEFLLSLPVNITVQTFRLDPWSTYFEQRDRHGLRADFRDVARVRSSNSFSEGQIAECAAWLRELGRAPWTHTARQLAFDGEQINCSRPGGSARRGP
jgi:radical SAM superfamily enzyme YgiQ (UPF0313 family)